LRKAIQIEPGYGSAHNNLAVIYASQEPPLVELARWHYQKALASGHPQNPELEKMFERKTAEARPGN
jgi:Tfp pilus assembly protein PilF